MINTNLFTLRNIIFIGVVSIVAHHFARSWFKLEN